MRHYILPAVFAVMFVAALTTNSVAGHHYHGYGCGYGMHSIDDMDANQDGTITFDEFSEPRMNKLKGHFKMLDQNNDELIDKDEWDQFLKWHGLDDKTDKAPKG